MAESTTSPAAEPWTVRRVLEWTTGHLKKHGSESPRLEAEILLAHARKCRRIELYTNFDEELTDAVRTPMRELVQRRAAHEPVAYLVGHREFFSLDFRVTPDVLIPRPDTETLVMEVLSIAKTRPKTRVLDLCTGSGCIAVAVAKNCSTATVTATDASSAALAVATENAQKHGVTDRVTFHAGDLFAALPDTEPFDSIASNPPYIPSKDIEQLSADVRQYEPRSALDGGPDGLDLLRRLIAAAPQYLVPGGWLFTEFTPEQAPAVQQFAKAAGFADVTIAKDPASRPRVLRAKRSS